MTKSLWLSAIVTCLTAALLIYFSRDFSEWIVGWFMPQPNVSSPQLAELIPTLGPVGLRTKGSANIQYIKSNQKVHHREQIYLGENAKATLSFDNGWALDLNENFEARIEVYRSGAAQSPVLLNLKQGGYSVKRVGPKGLLYIQKNRKIFSPDEPPTLFARMIEAPEPIPQPIVLPGIEPVEVIQPPLLPNAKNKGAMPDKLPSGDEETLSSPYIAKVLVAQSSPLRRCQLNGARDNLRTDGSMLLTLTIAPSGKMQKVSILQDEIQNKQFSACVLSVLERTQFKSFSGLPITLTYPLNFR